MSISPIFLASFYIEVVGPYFLLEIEINTFFKCQKIGGKAALQMLVKLTPRVNFTKHVKQGTKLPAHRACRKSCYSVSPIAPNSANVQN